MKTRTVQLQNTFIGGGHRVSVQTMLKAPAHDVEANVRQAVEIERCGCDILRMAVPDADSLETLRAVRKAVSLPLVADIHFDYRLALGAVEAGADKIRINPGNIGAEERVKAVADACRARRIPIRVGVNSGSIEKHIFAEYGAGAEGMVKSALYNVSLLEKSGFEDIVISVKASDPKTTVAAYRLLSAQTPYPLHLGVTEAGTPELGVIRSAAAIGSLLLDGIGDTIRVSLTGSPVDEVREGKRLLSALELDGRARLVSCPTCGRTHGPVTETAERVAGLCERIPGPLTVAVMGCEVNGPGEASQADLGLAFGRDCAVIFEKGKIVARDTQQVIIDRLLSRLEEMTRRETD